MHRSILVFGYLAPESFLPISSVIAASLGVVMMFGKNTIRIIARGCRRVLHRPAGAKVKQGPHFARRKGSGSHPARRSG